jgi:hypothetical protein
MTFVGVDDVHAFVSFWHHMSEAALSHKDSATFISEHPLTRERSIPCPTSRSTCPPLSSGPPADRDWNLHATPLSPDGDDTNDQGCVAAAHDPAGRVILADSKIDNIS